MKQKILSVRIENKVDESPDYSYLGEFKSQPKGWYVNREEGILYDETGAVLANGLNTHFERNDYLYITNFQHDGKESNWEHVSDSDIFKSYLNAKKDFIKFGVVNWEFKSARKDRIKLVEIVYCCQDAIRLEQLNRDWWYLGIIAKAQVQFTSTIQTLTSGGIWGIESDCEDYIKETENDQLDGLKDELRAAGFGDRAIKRAFQNVERKC